MRVEDGGETRAVRAPILQDIVEYLVHYQDRLHLEEHSGELLITWGPNGVAARPRPALPTRRRRPRGA